MNKKRYTTLTLILSLLYATNVNAACTKEALDEFKKVEDKYYASYQVNTQTKSFDIILNNPAIEKYNYSSNIFGENTKYQDGKPVFTNMKQGEYTIYVRGKMEGCNDILKTITITLPRYNDYYGDPLCEGIEEFVLCQESYDKEIDRETFESRVNTYKKTKIKKEQEEKKNEKAKEYEVISYIKNNLTKIIIVIAFLILATITIIVTINRARKSRRLE